MTNIHRGLAVQKATEFRRLIAEVAAKETALRQRQDELTAQLAVTAALN